MDLRTYFKPITFVNFYPGEKPTSEINLKKIIFRENESQFAITAINNPIQIHSSQLRKMGKKSIKKANAWRSKKRKDKKGKMLHIFPILSPLPGSMSWRGCEKGSDILVGGGSDDFVIWLMVLSGRRKRRVNRGIQVHSIVWEIVPYDYDVEICFLDK